MCIYVYIYVYMYIYIYISRQLRKTLSYACMVSTWSSKDSSCF